MKHTPGLWRASKTGPWIVTGPENNPKIVLIGSNTVHTQSMFACEVASIEDYNNRKLAAAAPDLLEALEKLLDMVTDSRLHGDEVDLAAEAIYKARGE